MIYLPVQDVIQLQKTNNKFGQKLAQYPKTEEQIVELLNGFQTFEKFNPIDLTEQPFMLHFPYEHGFASILRNGRFSTDNNRFDIITPCVEWNEIAIRE